MKLAPTSFTEQTKWIKTVWEWYRILADAQFFFFNVELGEMF